MKHKPSRKSLVAKLDRIFSEYIRMRDAREWHRQHPRESFGYVKCCTCDTVAHWREMDAGHFVNRDDQNTRYDERNVHAQCRACNRFHGGRISRYAVFVAKRYGNQAVADLDRASRIVTKRGADELTDLINHYSKTIKEWA